MSFFTPFFLYLLPLSSLPIILHFIFRFRLKKVDFSSLFFLVDLKKERFNFYRLRDILLLILRTLFIAFLILSLSRPYILKKKSPLLKILPQKAKSILIILDDSYSMGYENNFEKGKEILKEIIKNLNKNSKVTILLTSKRKIVENEKVANISESLIENLKISYDISYAKEILENLKDFDGEVYLITDLQEYSYSFLKDFKSNFLLRIVDLGKENFKNCGIVDFRFLPEREEKIAFQVKLANYSQREVETPITIYGEDFVFKNFLILSSGIKEFNLEIPKRSEKNIITGRVEIGEDNLVSDNIYYFVYEKKKEIPLLIAYEREEDIFYLRKLFSVIKNYQINYLSLKEIKKISFSSYSIVFLVNPSKIDQFLKWQLLNYLKKGGKVILILGRTLEENKFEEIFETKETWEGKGFLTLEKWEKNHFIFQDFKEKVIKEPKFYRVVNLQEKNLKVLAYFNNNFPFLLEDTLNNLLIFTTNFSDNFTDMPSKIIFLPLILRTLEYLGIERKNNFFVGETIVLNFDLPQIKIMTPFGNFLKETYLEKGTRIIKFNETKEPGIYQFEEKKVSINVKGDEGNLKKLNLKERENLKIIKGEIKLEYEITYFFLFLTFFIFLTEVILFLI
ncbi:MAG: BatA domain-containing protein [candidate division WOR-3 bacterium]|nr:BatA domain-containing protein [candidate division WOR-3 bacterium]MCX7836348.1 BatA domain-containing protein [candidate division WOR-3 bacterium]MDW8113547.1 BatA domain-containing protein [candidate division WOR-3 bacterium]